ncbi:MAG: septum formation initiator family protein [Bacilli bacterium]|nr:septum formation initiator family protein [Bacilli bacterium]
MKNKFSLKSRRRLFLLVSLIFVLAISLVSSVFNDWMNILSNDKEYKKLNEKYDKLVEEQASLESEVTKLQDNDYVARYAREKYLYTLPDEIIIRINEDDEKK